MNILLKIEVYKYIYRCILFYIKSLWILNVEWEMFKIKKNYVFKK